MTSLIDVVFLLLMFFMLTSTFSRFAEIELAAAGAASGGASQPVRAFLALGPETLRLGPEMIAPGELPARIAALRAEDGRLDVLVAPAPGVTSQRLAELLVLLRGIEGITVTVLEGA
ncbi:biopolymer transport protein ExbD [Meinhardsimonia xiamenensis]|jgi:biopolymer transport protein ExbD|uniref:Biopolymer transport protein ExbD n=2 Tax=Meinhardsimonia xiamenensis TaxID=990712 RepID=A0A1G9ENF9_9RHOB|nr:outer membrane transport energization protein ExbD [Meinhardsimonia xiamenensis]SDK77722.1 biopolymer transport protein ExbD [Meinhardsimonia xiamenensis]